ncbi:MAG: alpha/beta fold hydrolase [Thermoanaerobaculaceae bacterium]
MKRLVVVGIGIVVVALGFGGWTRAVTPAAAPQVRAGTLAVPGGSLYYEVAGKGDAVVLVHDGLVHHVIWNDQLAAFARDFTVVRYDRRGYGKSPDSTAPFSNEDDLDALLTHLGIASASLVGMSAGGGMVVDYCLAHPERVDAMVLVGAVVSGLGYTDHFASRGGRVDDALRADPAGLVRYFLEEDPYEMAPASTAARARLRQLTAGAPLFMASPGHRLRRPPARPALPNLGEVHVPTLVVVGEHDIPDVHAHGGALEAGIRGARRKVVSGAGHLVPFEQPEAFNAAVIPFLLGRRVNAALAADDAAAAMASYAELRKAHPELVPFTEPALNQQGYRLLGAGRTDDAIALFRLNAEAYPDSWNVHDSLGEALAARGDTAGAIAAYQRSLQLNPGNGNGATQLETLRARASAGPAGEKPTATPTGEPPRERQ